MNKPSRIVPFIVGLVLGVLGAVFLPGYVRPYLPEWALGKTTVVKGIVVAKQKKEGALLLTVNTAEGALLATFTAKADEVALLVNEKDVMEFTLPTYAPLIDNPRITRIVKEQEGAPAPAAVVVPAEKGRKETQPQQQGITTGRKPQERK